ncbi:hypothetical protein SAMN05216360_104140 [Methylobacterium phyllostachyos]|uniref:Uncharacterized protein n=1 Tax=Methylobacterium phyllostachyos TaxID=582672 RepID=A0A1G9WW43_9HYPH|nr:hypothetical protein [Methylobacterium phyllostachyos]SDM88396.1 hypothetical protein SAMN05216360_104140 [Methylobacterium phyllostachyos]
MSKQTSILLSAENTGKLSLALYAIRGRAKVFPSAFELVAAAERAEKRLSNAGVALSKRAGCHYAYREAGPMAKSYKYRKTVVSYSLKRTAKGWVVVNAGNENVSPKQAVIDRIDLTARAKEAVLRAAMSGFGEIPAKAA